MTVTHTADPSAAAKKNVRSGFLLAAWGVATGLVLGLLWGLVLVQLLDWLGLSVDTAAGRLLHEALLP